jgi:hypothetical protein
LRKIGLYAVSTALSVVGVSGCASQTNHANTTKVAVSQSSNKLTESEVDAKIRDNEKNHSVSDIHMISLKNVDEHGFAFASFKLDGQEKYVNIYDSSLGVFTASNTKGHPLQYVESYGDGGFSFVTGVVVDKPTVKKVIVTFSNGSVEQVPVINGHFWIAEKVGSQYHSNQVLGVTSNGSIVKND